MVTSRVFCRSSVLAALLSVLALGRPASAAEQPFSDWLATLRQEALGRGISAATVQSTLHDIQPIPRVIELDRKQPEFTLTFQDYLAKVVNDNRVQQGRRLLQENQDLLQSVGRRFAVQPRFVVALWGIETDYGRLTGGFKIIPALATLAYDGRRSAYFRSELFNALNIVDKDHIDPAMMSGSWAGAMGQTQFMPSSFLRYAVDFDGDGRRDIWTSRADIFASAANYLASIGWRDDATWGRPVLLPPGFKAELADLKIEKALEEWRTIGVRRLDGGGLPVKAGTLGSIVLPAGDGGPAFLVYANYRAILKWNRSSFFAIAVGTLADRIGDR